MRYITQDKLNKVLNISGYYGLDEDDDLSAAYDGNRSAYNKGIPHSKEHCKNLSKALTGRKIIEEHRMNMKKALKGVPKAPRSKEHCEKIRLRMLGKQCAKGYKHTEEAKTKIGKAKVGNQYARKN